MELQIMYPPQKDSPTTFLMGAISSIDTFAIVGNVRLLPSSLPFPLTLGPDKSITEVVMVTEIDTETNRIVFERGSGALPWIAGTTVGRVFNASDLKTVQDNIVGINQEVDTAKNDILDLKEDVSNLVEVVGDSEGGLVKNLEDEITRATNAEVAEVLRATTAEGVLETKKVDRSDLPQVLTDTSYSADATKLTNTLTRYNASTKVTTTYNRLLPIITPESVGLMTPEAYNEITALRNDVGALQQQGGRFIGLSFATKAALDSYVIPEPVKSGDFTYVLDDETHADATTRYIYDGAVFNFGFVVNYDPVGLATDEVPGLVRSTDGTVLGKIFVEADGTMSVVGWDGINLQQVVDGGNTIGGADEDGNIFETALSEFDITVKRYDPDNGFNHLMTIEAGSVNIMFTDIDDGGISYSNNSDNIHSIGYQSSDYSEQYSVDIHPSGINFNDTTNSKYSYTKLSGQPSNGMTGVTIDLLLPAVSGTLATIEEVNALVGDIGSVLDTINGEVI